MKMFLARLAAIAAAVGFVTVLSAGAADDPDIETIMKKVNNNKNGLHKALGAELRSENVNWDDAAKKTKEYCELIDFLGQNDPPKGDKKSWEKLTKEYAANAKALKEACEKKDKSAATAAHGKISKSCKSCHDAHRG